MLNWICPKCERKIILASREEVKRGHCSTCEVNSWPPEKRKAFRDVVGAFAKGVSAQEMDDKINESIKHM